MSEVSEGVSFADSYNTNSAAVQDGKLENKDVPARRFKDAKAARASFMRAKQADDNRAKNRAVVQDMVDGGLPFNRMQLKAAGRPDAANVNFQEGSALVEAGTTNYNNLIDHVDVLAYGVMRPGAFDPVEAVEHAENIAVGISKLIRSDDDFAFNWETIARQVTTHGVAALFFHEVDGVKWTAGGLDSFWVPKNTKASEAATPVIFARRMTPIADLWEKVEDEAAAKDMGWNLDVAKKAMCSAYKGGAEIVEWGSEWAALQTELKNNDLGCSYTDAQEVPIIHMFVKERSGKYSHYQFVESLSEETRYLYERPEAFDKAPDAFIYFLANNGNGPLHSIRGLAYRMFPVIAESNKLRCSMIDGLKLAMAILMQSDNAEDMDDLAILVNGPTAWIPPDAKLPDRGALPNLAQQAMPVLEDLRRVLGSTTGQYSPRPSVGEGQDRTRFDLLAQIESSTSLTTSAINVFYRSFGRFLNAILRRVQALDPAELADSGDHPEVLEFYQDLEASGTPAEAVKSMKELIPVKALGLGSPSQRLAAMAALTQLSGRFDEVGRRMFDRMIAASYVGHDQVDALIPRNPVPRPTIDNSIAELEHAALRFRDVAIKPTDMHATHAQVHLGILVPEFQIIADPNGSAQKDMDDRVEDVQYVQRALTHINAHIDQLREDPSRDMLVGQLDDQVGQISAAWKRLADQLQSEISDSQASQAGQEGISPEAQAKLEKHRQEMQFAQENFDQAYRQREQDFAQKQRLRQIQTDQRLKGQIQTHALKTYGPGAVKVGE